MARQRGASWVADALVNNRRIRKQFATRAQAEHFEKNAYAIVDETPTSQQIGKLWRKQSRSLWGNTANEKNAFRIADELIERLGPSTQLSDVSGRVISKLVEDLRKHGNTNNTINTKMSILSRLLTTAKQQEMIDNVPHVPFFTPGEGRIRSLTEQEEQDILAHLPDISRAFATFLLYTGCRPSEARRIGWEDVSADSVTFWKTKTGKPRTVPLTSPAAGALAYARSQGFSRPWEGIVYQTFLSHWRKARAAVGLADDPQATPYVMRHTCATRLGKAKLDPIRMANWLGHARLDMTRRYTHLSVEDLQGGADALERFASKGVNKAKS
jgi:integrase